MLLHQRYVPGLAILSYVIGDQATGEAVVIDPTRDVDDYIHYAREHDLHIRYILETHVHADFVCGSRELQARLGGEPKICTSGHGGPDWTQPYADEYVQEGQTLRLGKAKFGFLHTPGHTPEHITITLADTSRTEQTPWLAFTGDFLMVNAVGRPDLLGESEKKQLAHQLYESLFSRLPELPDYTLVQPAHGAGSLCGKGMSALRSSTVGYEQRFNPSLRRRDEDEWVADLLGDMPLAPPYFRKMKRMNCEGPRVIGPQLPGLLPLRARQVHSHLREEGLVLDVRPKEAFAAAHVPGAISIGLGQNLSTWAGWVLPYDKPIVVVPEDPADMPAVVTALLRVGFDDIRGYLEGGIEAWATNGHLLERIGTMSVHDLHRHLSDVPGRLTVLDVRTISEWNAGHIEHAVHVHGGRLREHLEAIPRDRPVAVICGSGYRSSVAASILQRQGHERIYNVIGGMSAWKAANLPTVSDTSMHGV